jgi:ubiquinone/menaquinone biosynthesis C-methylase UbiE
MVGGGSLKDYNHAERRLWQDAPGILAQIGVKPGDTVADIGSGDGYFSIPAAKMVGPSGSVYALDVYPEAVAELQAAAEAAGLTNIKTSVGEAESTVICKSCTDIVLMANVLHDFNDPVAALKNARIMLKPGGRIADLDWKKKKEQLHGPPFAKRFDQVKAASLLHEAGFRVVSSTFVGPFHYLLIAEPA